VDLWGIDGLVPAQEYGSGAGRDDPHDFFEKGYYARTLNQMYGAPDKQWFRAYATSLQATDKVTPNGYKTLRGWNPLYSYGRRIHSANLHPDGNAAAFEFLFNCRTGSISDPALFACPSKPPRVRYNPGLSADPESGYWNRLNNRPPVTYRGDFTLPGELDKDGDPIKLVKEPVDRSGMLRFGVSVSYSVSSGLNSNSQPNQFFIADRGRDLYDNLYNSVPNGAMYQDQWGFRHAFQQDWRGSRDLREIANFPAMPAAQQLMNDRITRGNSHGDGWNILSLNAQVAFYSTDAILGGEVDLYDEEALKAGTVSGWDALHYNYPGGDTWSNPGNITLTPNNHNATSLEKSENRNNRKARGCARGNWDGGVQDMIFWPQTDNTSVNVAYPFYTGIIVGFHGCRNGVMKSRNPGLMGRELGTFFF
jgi:hypothetical protein